MRLSPTVVVAACCVLVAATPLVRVPAIPDEARPRPTLIPSGVEPPATLLMPGDMAPDVSWEGPGSRPQRLRDLRTHGHVLLVFSPTEVQLQALERDRDRLLGLQVLPAAVLDRSTPAVGRLAHRLGLRFTMIPDPKTVIAGQFNTLDPATHRTAPAWFVVDRWGRVRALDRSGLPDHGYTRLVSAALDLPASDVVLPGSTR